MHKFKELSVWQKSVDLAVDVYQITKAFPSEEKYGLRSQINRCAVSIPSNIAEGSQRKTRKDFAYFLRNSRGSSAELETQLLTSERRKYGKEELLSQALNLVTEIQKMIFSFREKVANDKMIMS